MGGIFFAVYTGEHTIDTNFTNAFMKLKTRGKGRTEFITEQGGNALKMRDKMSRHEFNIHRVYNYIYGYHRTVINDPTFNAIQPFEFPSNYKKSMYKDLISVPVKKLLSNSEIYNYNELIQDNLFGEKDLESSSDAEIILPLYIKYGINEALNKLNGEFAMILTDNTKSYKESDVNIFAARDPLGIRPLKLTYNNEKTFFLFVSETKGIPDYCLGRDWTTIDIPPGTFWSFQNRNAINPFTTYINLSERWSIDKCIYYIPNPSTLAAIYSTLKDTIQDSVLIRSTEEIGVLLSDGFNSSLIMSILAKNSNVSKIHAFSLGSTEGKDTIQYLRQEFPECIIVHHSIDDTIDIPISYEKEVPDTKYIGLYLLLKYIETTNVKVVLYGGFLDTLFKESHDVQSLLDLSIVLNVLDATSAKFDIELRYPYLDLRVIDAAMSINPILKQKQKFDTDKESISKFLVRKSFTNGYLSNELLWKFPKAMEFEYTVY
jgi:asparagine synthase (glutamine-hydrolysing)